MSNTSSNEPSDVNFIGVGVRHVASPLTREMLRALSPGVGVVQFTTAMRDQDYRALGEWIRDYPHVLLQAHASQDRSIMDLDFLRYFPTVTRFSVDAAWFSLASLDGLGYLSTDADLLHIGRTRKRLSLAPLTRFTRLRRLYLEGNTQDLEVVSGLATLESLSLRSITLTDLAVLRRLTSLRALELKLGATRDLRGIGEVGDIRYLELSKIFGFHDLQPLEELSNLECLCLRSLPRVTRLPNLGLLTNLRKVTLEDVPGITETELLRHSPGLEVGSSWQRPILTPDLVPDGVRVHVA